MFDKPSIIVRFEVGKALGLVFGLAAFFLLPYALPDAGLLLRWGALFWYVTLGGLVGIFGVLTYYPKPDMWPFPWWAGAAFVGSWMNFVLTLLAYDTLQAIMLGVFGKDGLLTSPFWFVAEGIVVAVIIGYFSTRLGGEGKATVYR
ncbi:MAG: hypothetical protein OEZ39_13860 [Gammaproteobacteria bacterium]|nr:hypothetical protein [Gammaproteobacteria bacterium]MDH5652937.1 hypothetical protein [Gammaproteobacteria bacterium]